MADIGGKTDITINLKQRHIEAFDKALFTVQSRQLKDIIRNDFLLEDLEKGLYLEKQTFP